uniref:palmitoyltransferase ZDHHC19-like n=1 Tax=Ictidomys tridecemlineatus TaxID=43179 RepID=UPI001A9F3FC7|nr:palmitoyltransferase ZDHHC19-like [Ictidomys tridecemlineatus]
MQVVCSEWGDGFALVIAFLFLVTFGSLVSLSFSNPGILYPGSLEQDPEAAYITWMYQKAFLIPWCPHCSFHCPPRTFHCEYCNICVEEFDHHCTWVNNFVGHCNSQLFLLLLGLLCLYLGAVLVRCVMFFVCTREMPFFLDKAMAYLVALPATCTLLPLILGLLSQAIAVSTVTRPFEGLDSQLDR